MTIAAVLALAACGDSDGAPSSSDAPEGSAGTGLATSTAGSPNDPVTAAGFVRCEDVDPITAPDERYRSEPVYVANEMPTEKLHRWAQDKPGFEELWIDRDHNGWVTLAFSQGADERQADLEAEFPDVGAVAVEVDWTSEELADLQKRVTDALADGEGSWGTSLMVDSGYVGAVLHAVTEEHLEPLAPFADEPVCVSGRTPDEIPPAGAQPTGGDGWRLLGDELTGPVYRTGIATNQAQYERLWQRAEMTDERPEVDFEGEVVIWFGAVYGSGCEIRLDDVVVDQEQQLVHGDIVIPDEPVGCNDDANPHAFVVAVQRSQLPAGPFAIQLDPDDPPRGAPEERTLVDADLSTPGAVAPPDAKGPDPELGEAAQRGRVVTSGDVIEPGYPERYTLYVHCGIEILGQLNDVWWRTDEALGPNYTDLPEAWLPLLDDVEQTVEVEVLLTTGSSPRIEATANGHTVTYHPTENVPGCD